MASRTPGTFSFDKIGDMIHRARLFADAHTPGLGALASGVAPFIGGPAGLALQGAAQPDVMKPNPLSAFVAQPYAQGGDPMQAAVPTPATFPQGSDPMAAGGPPQASGFPPGMPMPQPRPPQASQPVPMPMVRPAEAPQEQPDMGFFARNTAMMQDPMTGQFIDPSAAQRAQVRGPDLINKMMAYLHNKDIG